jgi:hypothetical protein
MTVTTHQLLRANSYCAALNIPVLRRRRPFFGVASPHEKFQKSSFLGPIDTPVLALEGVTSHLTTNAEDDLAMRQLELTENEV